MVEDKDTHSAPKIGKFEVTIMFDITVAISLTMTSKRILTTQQAASPIFKAPNAELEFCRVLVFCRCFTFTHAASAQPH
uniref:Uncharacterized protein n=1 Tax=Solanum tuberosum TaxID=4113 RepID=M0ZLK7_SOLTU